MKDKVFIAWSGSNEVALKVKRILEDKYNYVCSIGGNSDNNSKFSSVGDTVIQQIKSCNQAIVVFQNRDSGVVSNNLFFELGYVLSMYGQKKVHCVKRRNEEVVLPSDFDSSFVESIDDQDSLEIFADGIVKYFISRQKMSVDENKMYIMDNRYLIHDKIVSHYSESGSKCSDYELAQYILFYMQGAHLFEDEKSIYKEIKEFKAAHHFNFSTELGLAVNICLTYLEMVLNIKQEENTGEVFVDQKIFWKIKNDYEHHKKLIGVDGLGSFEKWASLFVAEQLSYAYMLIANNDFVGEENRKAFHEESKRYAEEAIQKIVDIEQCVESRENNDSRGVLALLKAYVYRNMYISKKQLEETDAAEWLWKSMDEREALKNNYTKGTIDTKLYNAFRMEYYLSLINCLTLKKEEGAISSFDEQMYKEEIDEFLKSMRNNRVESVFLRQIADWCYK